MAIWLLRIWLRIVDHSDEAAREWLPILEARQNPISSRMEAWWWFTVGSYSCWNDQTERGPALLQRVAAECSRLGYQDILAETALALQKHDLVDPRDGALKNGASLAVELFAELGDREAHVHAQIKYAEYLTGVGQIEEAIKIAEEVEESTCSIKSVRAPSLGVANPRLPRNRTSGTATMAAQSRGTGTPRRTLGRVSHLALYCPPRFERWNPSGSRGGLERLPNVC